MLEPYIPILFLAALVGFNAVALPALSHVLSARRPTAIKLSPYESGMPPLGTAHERFSVKFYLVAILFIVFDIEIVFLLPWAYSFRQLGLFGLIEAGIFIFILFVGYIYVWKRGAFSWE